MCLFWGVFGHFNCLHGLVTRFFSSEAMRDGAERAQNLVQEIWHHLGGSEALIRLANRLKKLGKV